MPSNVPTWSVPIWCTVAMVGLLAFLAWLDRRFVRNGNACETRDDRSFHGDASLSRNEQRDWDAIVERIRSMD